MNDDELRSALGRRASAPLSDDERSDVLRAARVRALEPRRRVVPRLAGFLVGTAAILVLVVIAAPILLSPLSQPAMPSNNGNAYPNVVVRSEEDLVAMANDSAWNGRIVVADATIGLLGGGPACQAGVPCIAGIIGASSKTAPVRVGYRDAPDGGELVPTPEGNRWMTKLAVPYGKNQVSVFQIREGSVDYLGPAQLSAQGDRGALLVRQVLSSDERVPTDNVYIVSGWWWSGHWPSCPVPQEAQLSAQPELDYFCQGSWITAEGPDTKMTTMIDGALQLPAGTYPAWSGQQSPGEPVQGVFAVRSAGCQIVLEPNCPVWRLLDMVDNSPSPAQQAEPSSPPSPESAAPSTSMVSVRSEQELADLIGDPDFVGKTVLAQLPADAIVHAPCASPLGTPVIACNLGSLDVTGPLSTVVVGLRDATADDGVQYDDGNGYHWVTDLSWPTEAGVYAFNVDSTELEYLGPARMAADESPLTIADVTSSSTGPSDDVYVVDGWLTQTYAAPCPEPIQDQQTPRPNIWDYYCSGSWLTPESEPTSPAGIIYNDGLHVQGGAYDDFAVDPQALPPGGQPVGYQPRHGIYLVRNAGCPELVTGGCPVWRMVGRIDLESAPSSSPTPWPPAVP